MGRRNGRGIRLLIEDSADKAGDVQVALQRD
jgi:hypothetical protein